MLGMGASLGVWARGGHKGCCEQPLVCLSQSSVVRVLEVTCSSAGTRVSHTRLCFLTDAPCKPPPSISCVSGHLQAPPVPSQPPTANPRTTPSRCTR